MSDASHVYDRETNRLAGQRRLNFVWEYTQAFVAGIVVLGNIGFAFATFWSPANSHAEALMANAFFLVIGFYFGRTNHARFRGGERVAEDDR